MSCYNSLISHSQISHCSHSQLSHHSQYLTLLQLSIVLAAQLKAEWGSHWAKICKPSPNLVYCSGVSCVSNLRVLPCRLEGFAWSSVQFAEISSRFQQSVPGHQGTSESQKNGPWAFRSCFCDSLMRYRIPGNSFPNLNMQLVYLFCTVILCDVVIVGLKVQIGKGRVVFGYTLFLNISPFPINTGGEPTTLKKGSALESYARAWGGNAL